MSKSIAVLSLILSASSLAELSAFGSPQPGDVFREYHWRPEGKWQRVTGPDAEPDGAKAHLPNDVNRIPLDDLELATRLEVQIEMLLCHAGTAGKQVRVNDNLWIDIPESDLIPGESGQGPPNLEYQSMRYPTVEIPLEQVHEGVNTFEFTCRRGTALGGWWPQWILYGVTFRVYYDAAKPHPTGEITRPETGSVLSDRPWFAARVNGPEPIARVDFIGLYEDFNWEGDGNYRQWHSRTLFGEMHNHIGTATESPYEVTWDTDWIPTQPEPIQVAARVVDAAGMCSITPAIGNLKLARSHTVRMCKPYDVPKRWSTRAGERHSCKVEVPPELSRAKAAKIVMVTWNGIAADDIGINGTTAVTRVGKNHDLSHDEFGVPVELIRPGTNTLSTFSDTVHHGIEVQWPGMVLLIRYDEPEKPAIQEKHRD